MAHSLIMSLPKEKSVKNESLFHYIHCTCGETYPVLKSYLPVLLQQEGLPQDTLVEKLETKGCPSCDRSADLHCSG